MLRRNHAVLALALMGATSAIVQAQSVISAQAGTIHLIEGDVVLNGQSVQMKAGYFPEIKVDGLLETREGRAEILLTPGSFLRLGEQSSVRMISRKLTNVQLEVLSGSAILECAELLKDQAIAVKFGDAVITPKKAGIYRIDAEEKVARVYAGEILLAQNGKEAAVKSGKKVVLDGQLEVASFDKNDTDSLARWSARRDAYVARATYSRSERLAGSPWGFGFSQRGWVYDPILGMFAFFPGSGYLSSPYGYYYQTPQVYYQNRMNAYSGGGSRGWGNEGGSGWTSPASAGPSPASSIRSAGSMGGGSMGGGGGISTGGSRDAGMGSVGGGGVRGGGGGGAVGGGARGAGGRQ